MIEKTDNKIALGIIGAMQIEVEELISHMTACETRRISGILFTEGLLRGKRVVVAKCGIGKVFAALCAEAMILAYSPAAIVNTGVAGTLTDRLSIGQVAVATAVVQHDMDTSPMGDPIGLLSGLDMVSIPADEPLSARLAACVEAAGVVCARGVVASGDQFIASAAARTRIHESFPGMELVACEMEGAAVGQVCYVNDLPFAILRAISDGGNEQSFADYPTFRAASAHTAAAVLEELIEEL